MSTPRHFLFLQGPHGPFFNALGARLRDAGAKVSRVGFNAGDEVFWRGPNYIPFTDDQADWPAHFAQICSRHRITDLALYGDTRPVHAQAIAHARSIGLRIHIFEEGYLRPYWITYERNGSNGNSALMQLDLDAIAQLHHRKGREMPVPPSSWGDMRQHIFYGALYHWFILFRNSKYKGYKTHRRVPVHQEAMLYAFALLAMPFRGLKRGVSTWRLLRSGRPYHVVLLQLEHDSSFLTHSPFADMDSFVDVVTEGFAKGAAPHHLLVFKAHPLDNDQSALRQQIAKIAARHGIGDRVIFLRGGRLARLLDHARSAVTVNSTAGHQVLWRGLPLKTFGAAIYDHAAFVSRQPLPAFFANPEKPDAQAYRDFRQFLLETSQIPGGYYSSKGRRQILRQIVDLMLRDKGPYEAERSTPETPARPNLRLLG